MSENLEKILNAKTIAGESESEKTKRLTTTETDDSAIKMRLANIYRDNPTLGGESLNFTNVEERLLKALDPNQNSAQDNISNGNFANNKGESVKENRNVKGVNMADTNATAQMNQMAAGAPGSTPRAGGVNPKVNEELSKNDQKFLEEIGTSRDQLKAALQNKDVLAKITAMASVAKISNLLTIKGPVATRVMNAAKKNGTANAQMHYAIAPNPVAGILACVKVPGKDYSKLKDPNDKSGAPKEPIARIKYQLETLFGYNPVSRTCDPSKVAGDPAITEKWVSYIYDLVSDTASINEQIFDENAIDKLHLGEVETKKYKEMGAAATLVEIKNNATRRPFGLDLFVVDPKTLSTKAAICGFELAVNGNKQIFDGSQYWSTKQAANALKNLEIPMAMYSDNRTSFNLKPSAKDPSVMVGTFRYPDGQPSATNTASEVANGKTAWVKVKVTLPVELKYWTTNKEGKSVAKKFAIYGYVQVNGTWAPKAGFPASVTLKAKTSSSSASGARNSSAKAMQNIVSGAIDESSLIEYLKLTQKFNKNAGQVLKGSVNVNADAAAVSNAIKSAVDTYKSDLAKAEANRQKAAEARKNKTK